MRRISESAVDLTLLLKLLLVITLFWRTLHPDDQRSGKVLKGIVKGEYLKALAQKLPFSVSAWAEAVLRGALRLHPGVNADQRVILSTLAFNERIERHRTALVISKVFKDKGDRTAEIAKNVPLSIFTFVEYAGVSWSIVGIAL